MPKKQHKPGWFILYALVILMIAVFLFEGKDGLPTWVNEFADFGIILFVFGAMVLWVRVNSSALWEVELRDIKPGEFHMKEYPPQMLSPQLQDEIHELVEARETHDRVL